ncbi:hypothetical protein ISS42_01985 [Candidatus Shapirobacteria bacterium]|nr:hypothetical protein [Candidatus Shapirobacteria bacterium]
MRKEVLLAIIIGILLGLSAMLAWESKKRGWLEKFLPPKTSPAEIQNAPSPTTSERKEPQLVILEPKDETISAQEKIAIKGEAESLATIIVIWEEGEDILVADEEGLFETEIDLSAGPNEIEISAYNDNNQVTKKILTITYSTAKF